MAQRGKAAGRERGRIDVPSADEIDRALAELRAEEAREQAARAAGAPVSGRSGKAVPSQERSRRRRDALLRAAIEVLAEQGAKSVTHRAVAARAGLPAASTTYYFESIHQLTEEALRVHVDERVAEIEALVAAAATDSRTAEDVARRFARALTDRSPDAVIVQYEVYLEAARVPALRDTVSRVLGHFEQLAEQALTTLGITDAPAAASALVALIDGFTLHRVARPDSPRNDADALFEAMRALFVGFALEADERQVHHDRLRRPFG